MAFDINPWIPALLFAASAGGVVWYFISGIKIKSGWQNGKGPLARWLDARRRDAFNMQLPEALSTMSNALRAGFSISQAFDSVVDRGEAPMSEEFSILRQQIQIGMSFEDALESMSQRVGSDDLTLVTTSILISRKTGGNVTEIFDRISETIRGRQRIERKIRSLTAQGRLQGAIVSLMPVLLGAVMIAIKPKMMLPFIFSAKGGLCILVMFCLIAVGWMLIRKIIRIDV